MQTCSVCQNDLIDRKPCLEDLYFQKDGNHIERIKFFGGRYCDVCQCPQGSHHHPGCTEERCPICFGELFECDCTEKTVFQIIKT